MVGEQLLNVGYIVSTLVDALIASAVIMLADKIIAHEIAAKHSLIMALVALFITPIIGVFIAPYVPIQYFGAFILPLIVWIILGEILLKADKATKAKVAAVAFIVYIILSIYLAPTIRALIPF